MFRFEHFWRAPVLARGCNGARDAWQSDVQMWTLFSDNFVVHRVQLGRYIPGYQSCDDGRQICLLHEQIFQRRALPIEIATRARCHYRHLKQIWKSFPVSILDRGHIFMMGNDLELYIDSIRSVVGFYIDSIVTFDVLIQIRDPNCDLISMIYRKQCLIIAVDLNYSKKYIYRVF